MWRYLKAAFWLSPLIPGLGRIPLNVLALTAAGIVGVGAHAVWFLALAVETMYLVGLASNRKFQRYVDARESSRLQSKTSKDVHETVTRILRELPQPLLDRYVRIREYCSSLRRIAREVRDADPGDPAPLEAAQVEGIDRLLWIELRLLYTEHMLTLFFERTREAEIPAQVARLERELDAVRHRTESPAKARMMATLEDTLATARARLSNYEKAKEYEEQVRAEVERLESKIRSLSELAVNRHEPNFIAGEIDSIAHSIAQTEQTMRELAFATGLEADERVPQLLKSGTNLLGRE